MVDIVSKNGNLLLNVGPDRRGQIPKAAQKVFLDIGDWLNTNGEGIYETRPWVLFGEGPTSVSSGNFSDDIQFSDKDFRFMTNKGKDALFVSGLKWPTSGSSVTIANLGAECIDLSTLKGVTLLGSTDTVQFIQVENGLRITLPAVNPNEAEYPYILKLSFDGEIPEHTPLPLPNKNPYKRVEAQDFDDQSGGVQVQNVGGFSQGKNIGYISNGVWTKYAQVDFGNADVAPLQAFVKGAVTTTGGITCNIWIDGYSAATGGKLLAACVVPRSGNYNTPLVSPGTNVTIPAGGLTGIHDVYIVYSGGISVDWFIFKSPNYVAPPRDAYERIEGEDFDDATDSTIYELRGNFSNGADAGYCNPGDWTKYSQVNFGAASPASVRICYGSQAVTQIEIWIDKMTTEEGGRMIASASLPSTTSWGIALSYVTPIIGTVTGAHDVYVKLGSISFDYMEFIRAE